MSSKEGQILHFSALLSKDYALKISPAGVEYGYRFISTNAVTSLAWGVVITEGGWTNKHTFYVTINFYEFPESIMVLWEYNGLILNIAKQLYNKNEAKGKAVCDLPLDDQKRCFQQVVEALYRDIAPTLVTKLVDRLKHGTTFAIGKCTLSSRGVDFQSGRFFKENHAIPWTDLDTRLEKGAVILFQQSKRATSVSLSAVSTHNAVLLPALCQCMKNA